MPSPTVENYLKALFHLSDGGGSTIAVSSLALHLRVSPPTVNDMVRKLAEEGWVTYRKYQPLELTEAGRKAAARVVRKHRLTEMFLVEKMGFGWEEVHHIAEQIEHVQSPDFFRRMDELMGFPTHDPHGSPIPSPEGDVPPQTTRRLSDCRPGETVKIVGLDHASNDFLHLLNDREIALGTELEVLAYEAFDGSLTVRYGGREGVVTRVVGEGLLVG